jgi:hypothetical protein
MEGLQKKNCQGHYTHSGAALPRNIHALFYAGNKGEANEWQIDKLGHEHSGPWSPK